MRAFLTALILTVVIGGAAAAILDRMTVTSADAFHSASVRLDPGQERGARP